MNDALEAALVAAVVLQPNVDACGHVGLPPVHRRPPTRHAVAITFDDGPTTQTREIVNKLRRATFFQLGVNVTANPALARLAGSDGELANHMYSHSNLVRLSSDAIRDELRRTSAAIERGACQRSLFRPPFQRQLRPGGIVFFHDHGRATLAALDWGARASSPRAPGRDRNERLVNT